MKRTFQWATTFIVATSLTGLAQQATTSPGTSDSKGPGQPMTVQGCLERGTGTSRSGTTGSEVPGSPGTTSATGSAGSPVAGAPGAPHAGQGVGTAASGAGMYVLRVNSATDSTRTGMPSASAGQTDERLAAGQAGGKVYHLLADSATNLAAHVGHQIEVTGTMQADKGAAGTTGSGASSQAGSTPSATSSMKGMSHAAAAGMIKVTNVKMIAATCR